MEVSRKRTEDAVHRAVNSLVSGTIRVTGGRLGASIGGMPALELTTVGRTSGLPRPVMLTAAVCTDDMMVVVASRRGDPENPQWYKNLCVNPEVTVALQGKAPVRMHARPATKDERATLWPQVVASWKGYQKYQDKSPRTLPLVLLYK